MVVGVVVVVVCVVVGDVVGVVVAVVVVGVVVVVAVVVGVVVVGVVVALVVGVVILQCSNKPLSVAPSTVLRVSALYLHVFKLLTISSPSKVHEMRGSVLRFGNSRKSTMMFSNASAVRTHAFLATKIFPPLLPPDNVLMSSHSTDCKGVGCRG